MFREYLYNSLRVTGLHFLSLKTNTFTYGINRYYFLMHLHVSAATRHHQREYTPILMFIIIPNLRNYVE